MNVIIAAVIGAGVSGVTAIIIATWVLSNKLSLTRSELLAEIGSLKTDLAVLKKSEELRDEKINRMWNWWMRALENGWMAHMQAEMKDIQG